MFKPGQSGNPSGRPKGSVNKNLAMLREAVELILPLVVARALAGDVEAQKIILDKGLPRLRAVDAPMEFTLPEAGDPAPARAVLVQAAEGALPLSCAKEIMTTLMPVVTQGDGQGKKTLPSIAGGNAYIHSLCSRS